MTQVAITPQYVNPPKQAGWMGSIKTADGTFYGCPPELLPRFAQGTQTVCEISYYQGKDGTQKAKIQSIVTGAAPVGLPPKQNFSAQKNPVESEQIFVVALLKEWMTAIPVGDTASVIHAINSLREAYTKTFGSGQKFRDDMKDSIDF